MGTTDMLLQLIADLQHDMSLQRGRRILLAYAHACSGARLALLFVYESALQRLVLLERSGRRISGHTRATAPKPSTTNIHSREQQDSSQIPLHGLFGSRLSAHGFQQLAHASTDPRCLPEERYWLGDASQVVFDTLGDHQGLLVLCYDTGDSSWHDECREEDVRLCATLLSAYLPLAEQEPALVAESKQLSRADGKMTAQTSLFDIVDKPGEGLSLPASYEVQMQAAIDQERNRIARDIHDVTAQQIAHVLHKLEYIQRIVHKQPEIAQHELNRTAIILKESLNDLRHGITSLIPIELENQEFSAALQSLLDEHTSNEPCLKIRYEGDDLSLLPLSLEVAIFRFIQEALNNVRKHAQASEAVVRINILAHLLTVTVSDNGRGYDSGDDGSHEAVTAISTEQGDVSQHLGLRTMRSRIVQAGGNWELHSKPDEGTTVKASFFLDTSAVALTNREREVLQLLMQGLTNRAIAEQLSISVETAKSHVHHIIQKMQVHDRTQAAVEATKQRLL
jgi:signal transduction histidine kinase/DNA-binding CsgD family transcriptional regulator